MIVRSLAMNFPTVPYFLRAFICLELPNIHTAADLFEDQIGDIWLCALPLPLEEIRSLTDEYPVDFWFMDPDSPKKYGHCRAHALSWVEAPYTSEASEMEIRMDVELSTFNGFGLRNPCLSFDNPDQMDFS